MAVGVMAPTVARISTVMLLAKLDYWVHVFDVRISTIWLFPVPQKVCEMQIKNIFISAYNELLSLTAGFTFSWSYDDILWHVNISPFLALCERNPPVTGVFPWQISSNYELSCFLICAPE